MILPRRLLLIHATVLTIAFCVSASAQSAANLPHVTLNADNLGPRPIEQLTGANIARNYAIAWGALAQALEQNRAGLLNEQFIGFAKDRLTQRITDQARTGIHVRIVDQGHRLKAVFYSLDGAVMQLIDEAQIQTQVYDGSKLIYSDTSPQHYLVLMTPGADRWYVRSLETSPSSP
jgi:urease gamma subunit